MNTGCKSYEKNYSVEKGFIHNHYLKFAGSNVIFLTICFTILKTYLTIKNPFSQKLFSFFKQPVLVYYEYQGF